jgi:hypothetical protein
VNEGEDLFDGDDEADPVPEYLSAGQIARATRSNRWKVQRKLKAMKLAEWHGTRWQVASAVIRERLPPVYDRVYAYFERQRVARAERSGRGGTERK